jgi:hypothetical protein
VAAETYFGPDSGITAATLRSEARSKNGRPPRLETFKIGGKTFTTLSALARLVELARASPTASTPPTLTETPEQAVDRAHSVLARLTSNPPTSVVDDRARQKGGRLCTGRVAQGLRAEGGDA